MRSQVSADVWRLTVVSALAALLGGCGFGTTDQGWLASPEIDPSFSNPVPYGERVDVWTRRPARYDLLASLGGEIRPHELDNGTWDAPADELKTLTVTLEAVGYPGECYEQGFVSRFRGARSDVVPILICIEGDDGGPTSPTIDDGGPDREAD